MEDKLFGCELKRRLNYSYNNNNNNKNNNNNTSCLFM